MRLVAFIAAAVAAAACSGSAPDGPPSRLTGVVVGIEARGVTEVDSFTLKAGDETYEIHIDPDRGYGFPPSHLNAHRAGAEPVTVRVSERDGRLIALSIRDA